MVNEGYFPENPGALDLTFLMEKCTGWRALTI